MATTRPAADRFARFTWLTLGYNLAVIAWGAFVRATGSGAGCGSHWPTCNGQVIPRDPSLETIIEFTHRASSGIALLMVVAMLWWARRLWPAGHRVRVATWAAMGFMLLEAAIGAGLVKFELVADNDSMARALTLGAHLINTQFLIAAIGLAGWYATGRTAPSRARLGQHGWWIVLGALAMMTIGMTGAIASLGDTLFPARSLQEGLAQDLDPTSHLLLRLRIWHPTLAVVLGTGLALLGWFAPRREASADVARAGRALAAMVLVQWSIGLVTLITLVPVPLQLLHLLSADVLWLAFAWLAATVLAAQDEAGRTSPAMSIADSRSNTVPAPSAR